MRTPRPLLVASLALLLPAGFASAETPADTSSSASSFAAALAEAKAMETSSAAAWTDANARARLEAMESEGVLRDPFWAHAFWARSRRSPTDPARIADLRWAIRFDPELFEARRELCTLLIVKHNPDAIAAIVEALTHEAMSFVGQRRAALALVTVGGGALVLALTLLALFAAMKTIPRIRHGLLERLRFLPSELRGPASILILATPLAVALTLPPTSAAFWLVLLGTTATWQFLDAWERRTCVWALGVLLCIPLGLLAWTRLAIPGLPTSYLQSLWQAQSSGDVRPSFVVENLSPPGAAGDPDWHASLALADRRAGRYAEAVAHLERAIEIEPREWSYVNNLANVKLLSGDAEGAIASYQAARTLGPREPLIRVNEAQAWVQKLEFHRADEALAEATRLGYRLPPLLGTDAGRVVVRDQVLDASAVWRRLGRGQGLDHALDLPRAASMTAGVVFPFRPIWLCIPLLVAAWWVSLARFLPRVSLCATCGTPVCRKCHYRVLRRSLCAACHAIRRDVTAPLKRQEQLDVRRRRRQRVPRMLALLLAALIPGSGYVLRGASHRAAFLLPAAAITLLASTISKSVLDGLAPGTAGNAVVPIALPVYGFLSLISLLGTWRMPEPRPADPMEAPPLPAKEA